MSRSRLAAVDALRGLALVGMLVVHVQYYADGPPVWADRIQSVIDAFFTERFWALSAFLFGVGFALQIERWGDKPGSNQKAASERGMWRVHHQEEERLKKQGSFTPTDGAPLSLTNYIVQVVTLELVFTSTGVTITRPSGLVVAVLFFAAQVAYSRWWFKRYRIGPPRMVVAVAHLWSGSADTHRGAGFRRRVVS